MNKHPNWEYESIIPLRPREPKINPAPEGPSTSLPETAPKHGNDPARPGAHKVPKPALAK